MNASNSFSGYYLTMQQISAIDQPQQALTASVEVLQAGGLVALPTETVYGLAADATNGRAVADIFALKGRPKFNPLICHVADLAMACRYGIFDAWAEKLATQFWPGPLTLVLPMQASCEIHDLVSGGLDTIALRCPRGIVARIANSLDRPLAAPSANISGRLSPTLASHVVAEFGDKIDLVVDGGPCKFGLESAIVKISDNQIVVLRAGAVTAGQLEECIGRPIIRAPKDARPEAPGMMRSHYAPRAELLLDQPAASEGQALLGFGKDAFAAENIPFLNLSETGNLPEAAANLYDYLKQLDQTGVATIVVQAIPHDGIGEAINDRLQRAAVPRQIGSGTK